MLDQQNGNDYAKRDKKPVRRKGEISDVEELRVHSSILDV
jgi:hypothetical protein